MYHKSITFQELNGSFTIPELVQRACQFNSRIRVRNSHGEFDAKSIMGMMALDLQDGALKFSAEGSDEVEAVETLISYLSNS